MQPPSSGAMPTLLFHDTTFHSSHSRVTSSEGRAAALSFVSTNVIAAFHWTVSPFCPTAAPLQSQTSTGRQTWHSGPLSRHIEELAQHWHSHPTQLEGCQKQSQFTTHVRLSQSCCGTAPGDNLDTKSHTDYRMCLGIIAGYGAAKAEYPSPTKTSLLWAEA